MRTGWVAVILGLWLVPGFADEAITARELKQHVFTLASKEWQGRASMSEGGMAAAAYIARTLAKLGLEPRGEDGPYQDVINGDGVVIGRNVCFLLPGRDARARAETIVIGAHYDHLGTGEQGVFRGADDNASGVAALLELAEHWASPDRRPARSVLFLAFDNEEAGLRGSEHWVGHPTVPLRKVVAMLCLDMLGRSMMDRFPGSVLAFGTEWSKDLGGLLRETPRPRGVDVWDLGWEFVGPRSDFVHFGLRGIPFVFFTTGTHGAYHTPQDVPEDVDYRSCEGIVRLLADFVERIADAPRPRFHWERPNGLREAEIAHRIVSSMIEQPLPNVEPWQKDLMNWVHKRTGRMLARKRVGFLDRAVLVVSTQLLTLTTVEQGRTSPDAEESPEAEESPRRR